MTDKQFKRVMVTGALLLALLVASFGLKSCAPDQPTYFINHSEIKDTTNEEYQKSLKDSLAFKTLQKDSTDIY